MTNLILFFARGGGGGSSGGGGYSGGSGSSTDGRDIAILAGIMFMSLAGLAIGYVTGKLFKRFSSEYGPVFSAGVFFAMTSLLVLALIETSSRSYLANMFYIIGMMSVWGGWYFGSFTPAPIPLWAEMKKRLKLASKSDKAWSQESLTQLVKRVFLQFQQDWSRLDSSKMAQYMLPDYQRRTELLMRALNDLNRLNKMDKVTIHDVQFMDMNDSSINDQDSFRVLVSASANDSIYDTVKKKTIFTDRSRFAEEWVFARKKNIWLLDYIDQVTAEPSALSKEMQQFALVNNLVYSLDMGWLLLPSRGQLFSESSFGNSDINNHVIGDYSGILIQMYEYKPNPINNERWLIGQINVPKSYGEILIRPARTGIKKLIGKKIEAPTGTEKYGFEWQDFNHQFEVYASDADRLASFELINPGFMAYMYDIDESIILEVVDNIIYFGVDFAVSPEKYATLLELLFKAHKELKL